MTAQRQTPASDPAEKESQQETDPLFRDETGGDEQFAEDLQEEPKPEKRGISREPDEKKPRRKASHKLDDKVTVLTYTKRDNKVVTQKRTMKKSTLNKKYGKAGKKNGEQVYGKKIAVETSSGKVIKKGVRNVGDYIPQVWKEGKPFVRVKGKEKESISIITTIGEKIETRERAKELYFESKEKPGTLERKGGAPIKEVTKPKRRIPLEQYQVAATIMIKNEKGEFIYIKRWSNLQRRDEKYTLEEMEAQAVNRAISTYCSETGISSGEVRAMIQDTAFEYGKYI